MASRFTRLLCLLPLLGAGGCLVGGPYSTHMTADGRLIPDDWSWTFGEPGTAKATRPLHFDSLYVRDDSDVRIPSAPSYRFGSRWYRCWPDGQVLKGDSEQYPPTLQDVESFSMGHVGRYKVIGDKVIVEAIWGREDWFGYKYVYEHATITDQGLLFTHWSDGEKLVELYRRLDFPGMKREPDWPAK